MYALALTHAHPPNAPSQECEVEGLAGKKEGCEDDVEFIRVQRSADKPSPSGTPASSNGGSSGGGGEPAAASAASGGSETSSGGVSMQGSSPAAAGVATNLALGHPAEVASMWVEVPLGSVRASLGYMSTFEDCYALSRFVEQHYKDRTE